MRLLGNTALLAPLPPPIRTSSGLYVSARHMDDRMQWWVIAVGPGRRLRDGTIVPPEVRRGDRCLCNPDGLGVRHKFKNGSILVDASIIEMVWVYRK